MVDREVTQTRSRSALQPGSSPGKASQVRTNPEELKSLETPKEGLKGVPSDTASLWARPHTPAAEAEPETIWGLYCHSYDPVPSRV